MRIPFPEAPYSQLEFIGDSVVLETSGKVLVLPTGDNTKLPLYNEYTLTEGRTRSAGTVEFTDDTNADTGLHHLKYPWIALYDPSTTETNFFLFTFRPKNLKCVIDSSGYVTDLTLYPGNGSIRHGRICHFNPLLDSNSDLIPDIIQSVINFSQTNSTPSVLYITTDNNFIATFNGKTMEMKL